MKSHDDSRIIFQRETASAGGAADPLRFPGSLRRLIEDMMTQFRDVLTSTARHPEPGYIANNVYLDIIDNPTLNAVAWESGGREFIGVNAGTLIFLYDSFLSLFSHPHFMPDVGEASRERTTDNELRTWLQREDVTYLHAHTPRDAGRVMAAQFLTLNAYNFVFAHEVGHLTKGHIKYLGERYGVSRHAAYAAPSSEPYATSLRYILEIGADENAAHGSLHMFKPRRSGMVFAEAGGLVIDFRTWAISAGIVFALFDRHFELHGADLLTSHPSPDVRFLNVIWSAWEEVRKIIPEESKDATRQTLHAATELNEFFKRLGMAGRPFSLAAPAKSSAAPDRELIERVAGLRDGLERLEEERMVNLAAERSRLLRANLPEL